MSEITGEGELGMWFRVTKRKLAIFFLAILIIFLCTVVYHWWFNHSAVVPEELIGVAIENTARAQSYRYEIVARSQVDGQFRTLSEITGEKAKNGDFHIKGVMVNSPVDIYQIGDITYHKDLFTNKWIVTEGSNLAKMQVLMTEINPLAHFNFRQVVGVKYLGQEKVRDERCYVLECQPHLENQYLELFWTEFIYQLWIDRKDQLIRKACIKARHKSNANAALSIDVQLYDFNQNLEIKPPR
ncbi:MAG: DUF2092 domain-containing protein [Firmicutes bacterium]|nr:DUF2092 domain-containing protein [Bacillota bacterium]